MSGKIELILL